MDSGLLSIYDRWRETETRPNVRRLSASERIVLKEKLADRALGACVLIRFCVI